jgi:hypothetical protein
MRRSEQVSGALNAVQSGHVSVEQLLREALARGENFATWVEAKLEKWPARKVRGPALLTPKTVPRSVAQAALRLARRRFGKQPGVASVHWGMVRQRGIYTGQVGIVVFVERKLPSEYLGAGSELPGSLEVGAGGRRHHIRIDVQAPGRFAIRHEQAAPGNRATVEAFENGTLSAIIAAPDGTFRALLSAHVAGSKGTAVSATALDGTSFQLGNVDNLKRDAIDDLAVTEEISAQAAAALSFPIADLRDPDSSDAGFALWIYTSRNTQETTISDVEIPSVTFQDGSVMEGLFASPNVTTEGDSGSPALDGRGNLVGFVVGGSATKTYLVPARRAVDALFA